MNSASSSILRSFLTKNLKWHATEQTGYFICEESSGKKTYLTPADLFRIDSRLPEALQWYCKKYSPEKTGELLNRTIHFWLAPFHISWHASGLTSARCYLNEVLQVVHYSERTGFIKVDAIGVGTKNCNGQDLVTEYVQSSVSYSSETLKLHIPGFNKRLLKAKQHSLNKWHTILFRGETPSAKDNIVLDDDIALAYAGLLF